MNNKEYRNKVMGCWMGKNIGGTLGMPMEWDRASNNVNYYTHDLSGDPLPNDDLDIQILWLLALEERGFLLDEKDLGEYFNEFMFFTHAEYGTAKSNLRAGLQPPVSGSFNNDFKDSCGSFIRAEIWACLFPGQPRIAAEYAFKDAIVDHGDGEGVYAEIFIAAMESAAFFETDINKLIDIGLSYISKECAIYEVVTKARESFKQGMPEEESRDFIMKNYAGHPEWHYISPEDEEKGYTNGKMGWDVPSNIMILIFALLYGNGDFEKSICNAVHYGEDSDCTAGTIASLFGIMFGIDYFPEKWTKPIGNKIVTCSIDPFRMLNMIPKTIDEMTDRVLTLREESIHTLKITDEPAENFFAPDYFCNIYDEMNTVKYSSNYLNVRLDYCGNPVLRKGESKKIRFILSNTSNSISSQRINVYIYSKENLNFSPSRRVSVFLTMAHMGSGIKALDFIIDIPEEETEKEKYEFMAEFKFENSGINRVLTVPFVLLNERGETLPVKWEKRGPRTAPNQPKV